jgi:hypothetical protein
MLSTNSAESRIRTSGTRCSVFHRRRREQTGGKHCFRSRGDDEAWRAYMAKSEQP